MAESKGRILMIEDDENLSDGVAFAFQSVGFEVDRAKTAAEGLERYPFAQLILLDVGLPDGDGFTLCRKIREASDVPVIMLTARDMETDEVAGLGSGADDYITKPFSLAVLQARVENLLRRTGGGPLLRLGNCALNAQACRFFVGQREVPVSGTEFRLLHLFMRNPGRVLSKEQILFALWGSQGKYVDDNILSVNISRLRSKIEADPKSPQILKTVYGLGYVWVREE